MLAAGILFIVVGAVVTFFGFGVMMLLPLGLALISFGVLLALFGAVINAIERLIAEVTRSSAASTADFRKGVESLCERLDVLIRRGAPEGAPVAVAYAVDGVPATAADAARSSGQVEAVRPLPPEMGKCPGCGRPREQFDLGCTSCGSKKPAVFS
jgi:hypothetical protein